MMFHEFNAMTIARMRAMSLERQTVRELLAFYVEAGADALIGEQPVDRMADEVASRSANAVASPLEGEEKAAFGRRL